jgi:hypothetical protein
MKGLLIFVGLFAVGSLFATDYASLRSAAVAQCEKISPSEYQSGLLFNPDGYRSYYVRSECLQRAAVQFRDEGLCAHVSRRWSLFSSSWGISETQCRKFVADGAKADRTELEKAKQLYASGPMHLQTFRVERNGNGRDFDIIPVFTGSYAHGYRLTFEIVPSDSPSTPIVIHSDGYYLDANANLRIYVRQSDIRQRFPGFALNRSYQVRATLTLDVGFGGQSGYWSDAFIESVFPVRDRSQSITLESEF